MRKYKFDSCRKLEIAVKLNSFTKISLNNI